MLISTGYLTKYVSKSQDSSEWIGRVVDNLDPKGIRRVKVEVEGRLEGAPEDLPWAHLDCGVGLGGGNYSSWSVPNVGSLVRVSFVHGPYNPRVLGVYGDENSKIEDFQKNYPASYGFKDEQGTIIIVDRAEGSLKLRHGPSGNEFYWDKSGNEVRVIKGSSRTEITGDCTTNVGGLYSVDASGEAKMKGSSTTLESSGDSNIKCATLNIS